MKQLKIPILLLLMLFAWTSAGETKDISEWELPEKAKARIGKGYIVDMAYSPDSKLLAVLTYIGTWLYNAQTGEELALLTGYTNESFNKFSGNVPHDSTVSFSPDGKILANSCWDGRVRVWDVQSRKLMTTIDGYWRSVLFSPDGKTLAIGEYLRYGENFQLIKSLRDQSTGFDAVTFSPDGTTLITKGTRGKFYMWNIKSGENEMVSSDGGNRKSIVFSPDSTTLAMGGLRDHTIRLLNTKTGKQKVILLGYPKVVYSLTYSPDGTTLASYSRDMIRLWDAKTGKNKISIHPLNTPFTKMLFTPDGTSLTTASTDGKIQLWDPVTGELKRTITHVHKVTSMLPTHDGKTLATGVNGDLLFYNIQTIQPKSILTGHTEFGAPAKFSSDDTTLTTIVSSIDHIKLLEWDLQTGKQEATFTSQQENVWKRELSPDGKILALKVDSETIQLWNTEENELFATLNKDEDWFSSMIFTLDSSSFVTGDSKGRIEIWDSKTGELKKTLTQKSGSIDALTFSRDGSMLAYSNRRNVRLWNMESGSPMSKSFSTTQIYSNVVSSAFSSDGTILVGGGYDAKIRIWDIQTGKLMDTLIGHVGPIESLLFLPSSPPENSVKTQAGETLASKSRDGTILFWDIKPIVETNASINITPNVVDLHAETKNVTIQVGVRDCRKVNGFQLTLDFDPSALRYVSSQNGNVLPSGATVDASVRPLWERSPNRVYLKGMGSPVESKDGSGALASITFEVLEVKASTINLQNIRFEKSDGSIARPVVKGGVVFNPPNKHSIPLDPTKLELPAGAIARLGRGTVNDIQFSTDNNMLAVASSIGIWLYDVNTGDVLTLLTQHMSSVDSITFSPDGSQFLSDGRDGTLGLWNSSNYQLLKKFKGKDGAKTLSPDGRLLFNGREIWDINMEHHLFTIKPGNMETVTDAIFSPDGKTLATITKKNKIELWDVGTGQNKIILKEGDSYGRGAQTLLFTSDGIMLAASMFDHNGNNNIISLWNIHTGELQKTYAVKNNSHFCMSMYFNAKGELITVSRDWQDKLYIRNFHTEVDIAVLEGHTEPIRLAAISPDQIMLASAGAGWSGEIYLWEIGKGTPDTIINGHGGGFGAFVLTPDGSTFAKPNGPKGIQLWDLYTLHSQTIFQEPNSRIHNSAIAYSGDGKTLAKAGNSWEVQLWDTTTQQKKATLTADKSSGNIEILAYSPDNSTIAASGMYGNNILLWDTYTGEQNRVLKGHEGKINSIVFSPDATLIASIDKQWGSKNNAIRLWDTKTGKQRKTIANLLDEQRKNTPPFSYITFSPDGRTIASTNGRSDIQMWDVNTGKHLTTISTDPNLVYIDSFGIHSITFSPDGKSLAFGGRGPTRLNNIYSTIIQIWDLENKVYRNTFTGHTGVVKSLKYSKDGRLLISGSTDSTALLWKIKSTPDTRLHITPLSIQSPSIGKHTHFNINMIDGHNVVGFQFTLQYDVNSLRYLHSTKSTSIKNSEISATIEKEGFVTIAGNTSPQSTIENGTIVYMPFEVLNRNDVVLTITEARLTHTDGTESYPITGRAWVIEPPRIREDVNYDWHLDVKDLEFVTSRFGQKGKDNAADVNKDGIVDIADLVLIRNALYGQQVESEKD